MTQTRPQTRQALTSRLLDRMQPGKILRDAKVRGLFAECSKVGGVVSLKIQADLRLGHRNGESRKPQTVRMTLGQHPALALEDARNTAARLLAEIKSGRDPRKPAASATATWTVGKGYAAYIEDMAKRPGTEASRHDMQRRLKAYLADWQDMPLEQLDKPTVEARHSKIAADIRARASSPRITGARAANAAIRDLAAVWDFVADGRCVALQGANPARLRTWFGEAQAHHEIPLRELPQWWAAVTDLANPLRRCMHLFGLLSGLRPGNLRGIRREWIRDLDGPAPAINFPAAEMKNREPFVLPLSAAMVGLVKEAIAAGDVLFRSSASAAGGVEWLFPSRGAGGKIQPMASSREPRNPALKDRTGHALRHTWKNAARAARLSETSIELLLAHKLGGVRDIYGSLAEQFDRLREDQETVSAFILARCEAPADAPENQK